MMYGLAVQKLKDKNYGYTSETHFVSANSQALMDNFSQAFERDTMLSSGEWEGGNGIWHNNTVKTRDAWGNTYEWSLHVYPLYDIEEYAKGKEGK